MMVHNFVKVLNIINDEFMLCVFYCNKQKDLNWPKVSLVLIFKVF